MRFADVQHDQAHVLLQIRSCGAVTRYCKCDVRQPRPASFQAVNSLPHLLHLVIPVAIVCQ